MAFKNENVRAGIPKTSTFQVGDSDVDASRPGDRQNGFFLPFPSEPEFTWVYYECTVTAMLDSGIAVHNRLPQVNNTPDTLGACDYADPKLAELRSGGVNLSSRDQYADIVQRMGHSRYWFRLWGQALRVGMQVPIPSIRVIGGVAAVPYDKNPQWAFNRVAPGGNYGGMILWHAAWSLWYTTAAPPRTNSIPTGNPSAHIHGEANPRGVQAPFTQQDDNAVPSAPQHVQLRNS